MRVIAGTARSLPLASPGGQTTRPTTDRIKETLFNLIQYEVPGCRFLDLFAGSGAVGIEALSRGAEHVDFVEQDAAALACIGRNLEFTKLAGRGRVISADCVSAILTSLKNAAPYDFIFMDPPYQANYYQTVIGAMKGFHGIGSETRIIMETASGFDLEWLSGMGFQVERIKDYKTCQHVFLAAQNID